MKNKKHLLLYLLFDYIAALFSWALFFIYRKRFIESPLFGHPAKILPDVNFIYGITLIPLYWLALHYISGYYRDVIRKSRLKELARTFTTTLIGTVILHFFVILNDVTGSYKDYYISFFVLLALQFLLTYIPRLVHTTIVHHKIISGPLAFRTMIIGSGKELINVLKYCKENPGSGKQIEGIIDLSDKYKKDNTISGYPVLGNKDDIIHIIQKQSLDEIILAFSPNYGDKLGVVMNQITFAPAVIKAIPDLYPLLLGRVKIQPLFDEPFIQVEYALMPVWQMVIKTTFDYITALTILVVTMPLMIIIAVLIKATSKGPVFYSHERIGQHGKPFNIYKFRTMIKNAEEGVPLLSKKDDPRITRIGKFLRKTRLDELPNFINVLKGEMSIVGPRPERKYYIDKIIKKDPGYLHLQKVKPGITSWGQVRYGYAENVNQMIKRLQYDLDYIRNMSLYVDFKILILTILTIFRAKGK